MFLGEVNLAFRAELGAPLACTAMQGAQHATVPLSGIASLQLFEQGDGVRARIGLQQWHDFTVPDRLKWVLAGAPTPLRLLWVLTPTEN